MQLVTVWSIFVIVICIPQFLYSLNMKFKKKLVILLSTKWILELNEVVLYISFLAAIKNILVGHFSFKGKNVKF